MVAENERFMFYVTHVEAEGQLLKIWAQTDETVVQSVASMLHRLSEKLEFYAPNNIVNPNKLLPNTHCCARGINNDFCRAKVISVRSDGMILVQFIDYGNFLYVPIHNLRLLDGLSEANYLFSVPEAATDFVLADIVPIGGSWLEEVVIQIRNILVSKKYWGVYKMINNYKALNLTMMDNDFSQLMIKRNMALYSPSVPNSVPQIAPVPSLRTPHQLSSVSQENWRMPAQNISSVQKVIKTNSFKAIQLEIGSLHDVQVSYVEEGPCKFSIQLVESIPYLNAMMEKINSQSHLPLQEPPIAGTVCLGLQSHKNRLCRVVLNSPGDTSCKVYYADYGNHEVLPFTSIYQIPDEFVIPNVFSIRFTLSGIMNWTITPELKDYFATLVNQKILKLRVCKGPMSPLTQYCDLFLQGKSIKDVLTESFPDCCLPDYPEPKRSPNGTTEFIFVSYVESITKFYVQRENDLQSLDKVMDLVEQASNTVQKLNLSQIRPEMPCIALYHVDNKWYRASIIRLVGSDKAQVFYVDYGNEEVVPLNNLRKIPTQLVLMLPKQAVKCSLHGFQSASMDAELTKMFNNLVLEERLSLTVQNTVSDTVIVSLVDAQNISGPAQKNIAEKLKEHEYLKKQESGVPDRQSETPQMKSQKCDVKSQVSLSQKQRTKNKNSKARDNWAGNNWEKEDQGQSYKSNTFESREGPKSKYRKDNENEQRHENRLRKGNDYSNGPQNNRFQVSSTPKDYSGNDRMQKGSNTRSNIFDSNDYNPGRGSKENLGNKISVNTRLDRSFGSDKVSDKDSDVSSRGSGRRNNRGGKRGFDDNRKRDGPTNNRNRMGRWENEEYDNHRKNFNDDVGNNYTKSRSPRDNGYSNFNKSRNEDLESPPKILSTNKDSARYLTSTPISKIPPPNITSGAIKQCTIVYYTNPSSFFVQLVPDNAELDPIMEKIYNIYSSGGKVLQKSEIKENVQCVAQYSSDEQWYRAVVKSVDSSSAIVHFVDYGNDETVDFEKLKEIDTELLKLPAQAIHCKLFCPGRSDYTQEENDLLANETHEKTLEAEFLIEENGVYQILIKESNPSDQQSSKYFNDLFANGVDLIKEKNALRSKARHKGGQIIPAPDYAPLNQKWLENKLEPGTKHETHLAWFMNPDSFYCHLASQQQEFHNMMNEIQVFYAKREPVSEPLQVGSSVIAILPDDGIRYRAEIVELNKPRGHVVIFIDYGDRAMVDPRKIYPVEKKFMSLPKQAIFCGLKNIKPIGPKWPIASELNKFFNVEKFESTFHELKNDKYLISIKSDGIDLASSLVDNNLAAFSVVDTNEIVNDNAKEEVIEQPEIPRIDLNLLEGQTLFVKVSSVEGVHKFYVQFYTYEACETTVDKFMEAKNPQVMQRLLSHQVCLGAGCLVKCRGKWRRGVVINFTKSNYDVRLIDTGEHETCSLNSMLGLPGQLARMQNQAIECGLFDVPLSTKANETLKNNVIGKDVKIFVEKVECNRLIVRLFDINGNKIKVVDTQNTEKINPVCSMQLLNSTHEVISTWYTNSSNIWLQRTSDSKIDQDLIDDLYKFYLDSKGSVIPEENELYAGLSNDGNWYRVKVTKIKNNDVSIVCIDYGNTEDIPIENLRILDSRFYLPHQLAIKVSLTVSLSGDDTIQKEILDPLLKDKVFTARFFNVNRNWMAELIQNGEKLSDKLSALKIAKKTTKPEFEYIELAEMVVGEKYDVLVSHIDNPSQFWLQRKEEVNTLKQLEEQLQESSAQFVNFDGIPEEKSLCLVLYSLDSKWYRAEVLDADDDIITVRFIDHGNTDVLDNRDYLKQLPEKWKTIKKYAIQCKLDVVPINTDDWTEETCARIHNLITPSNSLQALIITDKAPMRIDLFTDSNSVCKTLVEEKLAAYLQPSEELEEEIIEEVQLDPRSAFVSNIISIDEFWVQEEKWIKELEMMEDRLVMAPMFPPLTEIKVGLACIAHYPGDNGYYRATVLSHNEEETKVRFTDYGNSSVTKDLKAIPDDLANIRPLSRKCCLIKPDGVQHWPPGISDHFVDVAASGATIFILEVIEEGETSLVKLTHNDKDVAIELLELCEKSTRGEDEGIVAEGANNIITEERPSPIGEENSSDAHLCSVSYWNSPSEFWMHKKCRYLELDTIMERLFEAEEFNIVSEIKEGQILAAKFDEDNKWYRSKVLATGELGTEVFYIDYGNAALAKAEDPLRELPDDLMHIPALAVRCSLKLPSNMDSWSKNACEKFIDLVTDGTAEFRFEIIDNSNQLDSDQPMQVALFYDDQDVVDILCSDEPAQTESEYKGTKGANSSGDSAIQSEIDQHIDDVNPSLTQNSSGSINILCDTRLSSMETFVQEETVISASNNEIEKADSVNNEHVLTEKVINEHNAIQNNVLVRKISVSAVSEDECKADLNNPKVSTTSHED